MTRPDPDVAVPLSERLVETAARALLHTEWEWRVAGPVRHDARRHYSADCPLCRPDYGDNAQRIVGAVLAVVLPLLADEITAANERAAANWRWFGVSSATRLLRQLAVAVRDA